MAGSYFIQNGFNAGEWSPLLEGRNDLDKYGRAVCQLENFLLDPRGPAVFRPGFRYIAGTKNNAKLARLIPFEFSVTQAYIIEMGDQYFRFYKDQAQILSGTPYEIASPYVEADLAKVRWCQSADVLYLFHPSYAPRKLSRTGHTSWTLATINFNPPAVSEQGIKPATTLTLGATSGTGITFTAGASVFLRGDVGRIITSGVGRASITAFTSGTQVTCEIIDTFASVGPIASGSWSMLGSPSETLTPTAKAPVGAIVTLTASVLQCFRSTDVGKYVRINGGLVKITSYSSPTVVYGEILKALTTTTAAAGGAWTLETDVWSSTNGYPSYGTFFEERLILAGSTAFPETVWGSVVGDYENFTPGTDDADAFEFTLAGRQVNVIRWLEPREYLIVGTVGGEWRLGPEDTGKPMTPLNVVAKQERNYGSADVAPTTVSGATLFVQRAGRKVREFTYQWESDGYVAPDMTLLAEHITKGGIAGLVFQQEPYSVAWGWLTTGDLIALTYLREHDVVGWHRHPIDGDIESMAVIPGNGYDEVWAVVKRTVNGTTVRYVEMLEELFTDTAAEFTANKGLNAFFVDSGITYNGAATSTITGLGHLEGKTVAVLADGAVRSNKVVSGGQIALSTPASVVHVGLPYIGKMQTMRLDATLQNGTAQGRNKNILDVLVRVVTSGPFKLGPDENQLSDCFDPGRTITLGGAYPLYSGDILSGHDGGWEREGRIMLVQDKPLPLTVAALIQKVAING